MCRKRDGGHRRARQGLKRSIDGQTVEHERSDRSRGTESAHCAASAASSLFPHAEHIVLGAAELPPFVFGVPLGGILAVPSDSLSTAIETNTAQTVAIEAESLPDSATTEIVTGDAGLAICREATRLGADVVVVGRDEHPILSRLFHPSVSDFVVQNSPCPVLVVRADVDDRHDGHEHRVKILIAVDGSTESNEAARIAELLFPNDEHHLVSVASAAPFVFPDPIGGGVIGVVPTEAAFAAAEDDAAEAVHAARNYLPEDTTSQTPIGSPGATICGEAGEIHADVVVVGRGHKNWLSRLFDPSVSDYVIRHAPCPVLVVREPR